MRVFHGNMKFMAQMKMKYSKNAFNWYFVEWLIQNCTDYLPVVLTVTFFKLILSFLKIILHSLFCENCI